MADEATQSSTTDVDETPEPEVDEGEANAEGGAQPEAEDVGDGENGPSELDVEPGDEPEAEVKPKQVRREHEHKPTPAYVEMVVRKKAESGSMTKAALKEYRLAMLRKHGLPTTVKERKAYDKAYAEAKAARKALYKEERKQAREARKVELAMQATAAVES